MIKLTLGRVIVIYRAEKFLVKIFPFLESKALTEHTGSNVTCNESSLYGQGTRATHRIDKVALTPPSCKQNHTGRQHLVYGCCAGLDAVSATMQRLTRAVESKSTILVCNMYVENQVGVVQLYRRTSTLFFVKVVGNSILHAVGNELGMTEHIAIHNRVDRECRVTVEILVPLDTLYHIINLIGIGSLKMKNRFKNTHSRSKAEVRLIHKSFVTRKRDHTTTYLHIVSTQVGQFLRQHLFEPLKSFGNKFKFLHKIT